MKAPDRDQICLRCAVYRAAAVLTVGLARRFPAVLLAAVLFDSPKSLNELFGLAVAWAVYGVTRDFLDDPVFYLRGDDA